MPKDITKNILENLLQSLGLNAKEIKIYQVLLTEGILPAGMVIKKSGLKRGITYASLYNLEEKGLILRSNKSGILHFGPENPSKLMELVEDRKTEIKTIEQSLFQTLGKLTKIYKMSIGKPVIRYFEGEKGITEVFNDIYAAKKEIVWGCVDLEQADQAFPEYIKKELIPLRVKNKVLAHSFVADSAQARNIVRQDKKQLRRTVLLDKEKYPLPAEIDIYEDKIAMLSFTKGEFIGIIIENADFAESLRSVFKLAFEAKKSK